MTYPAPARQAGFSLIELMIAILIVGIIAAFAIPNYSRSVRRAERTDARAALVDAQALQERYFFAYNTYLNASNFSSAYSGTDSPDGYFIIKSENDISCPVASCYKLSAERQTAGLDDACYKFYLDSKGIRSASKRQSDGTLAAADAAEKCWDR